MLKLFKQRTQQRVKREKERGTERRSYIRITGK